MPALELAPKPQNKFLRGFPPPSILLPTDPQRIQTPGSLRDFFARKKEEGARKGSFEEWKIWKCSCLVDEFLLAFSVGTAVGSLARVGADVLVEDGLLPEAFRTLRTHVRLLTRVDPDVLVQDRLLPERLRIQTKHVSQTQQTNKQTNK